MTDDNRGLSAMGATFAERKAAREGEADAKQVKAEEVEDKAIGPEATSTKKRTNRRR